MQPKSLQPLHDTCMLTLDQLTMESAVVPHTLRFHGPQAALLAMNGAEHTEADPLYIAFHSILPVCLSMGFSMLSWLCFL